METKDFKQYVGIVKSCNGLFEKAVAEKADEATQIMGNYRYSEQGKEEKKKEALADLEKSADNMTGLFKEAVTNFCNDFAVVLPEDGKDHGKDIENALKIIDMLGFNLDRKNLANAINPLRGSFRSMKTVCDLLEVKHKNGIAAGVGFAPEVMQDMLSYLGINTRVNDYLDIFGHIEDIIAPNNMGDKYRFTITSMSNAPVVTISPQISYNMLACADWMQEAGEMYAELEGEFSSLFKAHIATDKELIESTLQGN